MDTPVVPPEQPTSQPTLTTPPSKPKSNMTMLIVGTIVLLLACLGIGYLLLNMNSTTPQSVSQTTPTPTSSTIPAPKPRTDTETWDAPINWDTGVTKSFTGTTMATGNRFTITTSAPGPGWIDKTVTLTSPANLIKFDYEFQSNAAGYLQVAVDGATIILRDETLEDPGVQQTGPHPLPLLNQGEHTITFRLDQFSDSASTVTVSDVQLGFYTD